MQVWEYTYVTAGTNSVPKVVEVLNEFGAAGWEVAGFASADKTIGLNSLTVILKRPRSPLPAPSGEPPEGWLPDPSGRHPDRHWSGTAWTQWVRDRPGGTRSEDPPYLDL